MNNEIYFGTDGWRARMDEAFTEENVAIVSQGIANYVLFKGGGHKGIAVGYDTRNNSRKFAEICSSILAANGIKTYLSETDVPTPVITFSILNKRTAGAVIFTASHNPPEFNGIKFIPEYAAPAMPDVTDVLVKRIRAIQQKTEIKRMDFQVALNNALIVEFQPKVAYVDDILKKLNVNLIKSSKLKIIFDPLYGTGRTYIPEILEKMDISCEVLHGNLDSNFGGNMPNPNERILKPLREKLLEEGADIGLACDGDADRSGAIDDRGRFISANLIFAALLKYYLDKDETGLVVRTVSTTHLIDAIAEKNGIEIIETPVGSKYIGKWKREKGILIGGESSGGLMFKEHIPEKDGIYTDLKILEMIGYYKKPFSKIIDEIEKEFGIFHFKSVSFPCDDNAKQLVMENVKKILPKKILGKEIIKKIEIDGFKFVIDDGSWMLIRPSGTEPLLRLSGESLDANFLDSILEEGKKILENAKKS
ncbi:MAG: phosphoglucomutase/phosphomannomutase family protein [Candidatus Helarchaeota archaeon]